MINNIDQIKETDLLSIISHYVDLKKSGTNYTGCCPFHDEKTPSFSVNPAKGLYKCFGCGEGGNNPVQFIMDLEKLTFPEAAQKVAQLSGITVEFEKADPEKMARIAAINVERQKEYTKNQKTVDKYLDQEAKQIIAWFDQVKLGKRVYNTVTLQDFQIFFVGEESKKKLYENRIIFPIRNHRGEVAGFAGRKTDLCRPKSPKYINSKESQAYQKSKLLYGLYENKRLISQADKVYLVEGYTDVMTMYQYGFPAVATCGTALCADQVVLLKRFTKNVVILRDGDQAGLKAARRDTSILLEEGLRIQICILPSGEDPDSFLRGFSRGAAAELFFEANSQDAIIWRIMEEWDPNNQWKKEEAYALAGQLLAMVESDSLRQSYINELCKKNRMGPVKKILSDVVKKARDEYLEEEGQVFDEQQRKDIIHYGLYCENSSYFANNHTSNEGEQISNFVVNPLMLVIGPDSSQRIIQIKNEYGKSFTLNIESHQFTTVSEFKKQVEGKGNYRYFGKPEFFERIKAKVYAECPDTFPIGTMGYHREGFYSWGNGISVNGKFHAVNEYGIVSHKEQKYYLPAFSKVQSAVKTEDDGKFDFERAFSYLDDGTECISLADWGRRMYEVHGNEGILAVGFYLACLFRDIIFKKFYFFPIFNLFGPPECGKSYLAKSLVAMFGQGNRFDPFNLAAGTPVAFKRKLAQVANGIIHFDEYSNNIRFDRIEALKGSYDGSGHEKGIASQDNRTSTTKVKAGLVVTGQQQPTQDIALFTRCVSLSITPRKLSLEQQKKGDALKAVESSGQLSHLTQDIVQHREYVELCFSEEYERWRQFFTRVMRDEGMPIRPRIVNNYLILFTFLKLFNNKYKSLGFDLGTFHDYVLICINEQIEAIYNEDELSIFWRIVEFLLATHEIAHYEDILIESGKNSENFFESRSKKDVKQQIFQQPKTLLYLRFTKVHIMYQERHQRQRNVKGLDLKALQHYLKNSEAFVGYKRGKKFGDKTYSCWVFDMHYLPLEIGPSIEQK